MRCILIFICMGLISCSSMKKTLIYSSLAGGLSGAVSGAILAPNKESVGGNALILGATGAAVAAGLGYLLYKDDPRNQKLNQMLFGENLDINLGNFQVATELERKANYQVPTIPLPKALKDKVPKQYLIKYKSKDQVINQGAKTFYVPSFNVFEHSFNGFKGDYLYE